MEDVIKIAKTLLRVAWVFAFLSAGFGMLFFVVSVSISDTVMQEIASACIGLAFAIVPSCALLALDRILSTS